ncbi:MAG: hypothetical protein GXZ11_02060 [Tissierellia bacterium]|nr:hypothetical protein [Tissierellia bacterium]
MLANFSKLNTVMSKLEERFLFQSDTASIHLLLNFYDLDNMKRFYPKYISMRDLQKDIVRCLRYRVGSEVIAQTLSRQMHEDINRLELYICLEGYKWGCGNMKAINRLESFALDEFSPWELSQMEYLYQNGTTDERVNAYRKSLFLKNRRESKRKSAITITVVNFANHFLKEKVRSINEHTDRQIIMDYDLSDGTMKEEYGDLTADELAVVYRKLTKFLIKNAYAVYESAAWGAINDRVLKRY